MNLNGSCHKDVTRFTLVVTNLPQPSSFILAWDRQQKLAELNYNNTIKEKLSSLYSTSRAKVKAKQLEGKVIVILFMPLYISLSFVKRLSLWLMEVYNNLQSNNGFEVVFIAVKDANDKHSLLIDFYKHFIRMFSFMPWAAIPFWDIPSSKSLQTKFGLPEITGYNSSIIIVDSIGKVLQYEHSVEILTLYGALGYPFNDDRIRYLESEDDAATMQPTLNRILASTRRDYVISNKGDKVPIHTLENKVVAIFFYEESRMNDSTVECLKMAYEELAKSKENFEVVLVYLTDSPHTCELTNEESFFNRFKTMPWLAVPYNDSNNKKLKRIFEYLPNEDIGPYEPPRLVIFGPHGEFVEPFGENILHNYGIPAYPFTRAKVAKLETEKVKDLKLQLIWDPNSVFRRENGSEVPFSQILGKRVIIFKQGKYLQMESSESSEIKFLKTLKRIYLERKGTNDEFEVIVICESKVDSAVRKNIVGDVSWLVSLASELLPGDFGLYYMYDEEIEESSILVFDRDGRLVRRTVNPTFNTLEFPFYNGDLEEEAVAQLNTLNEWNYWDYYPYRGRIYSTRDKLLYVYDDE